MASYPKSKNMLLEILHQFKTRTLPFSVGFHCRSRIVPREVWVVRPPQAAEFKGREKLRKNQYFK